MTARFYEARSSKLKNFDRLFVLLPFCIYSILFRASLGWGYSRGIRATCSNYEKSRVYIQCASYKWPLSARTQGDLAFLSTLLCQTAPFFLTCLPCFSPKMRVFAARGREMAHDLLFPLAFTFAICDAPQLTRM